MMHWQYTPYVLPLLITAATSAILALFAWRRRPASGATLFALLMLAVSGWPLGYALELGSADLPIKLFWARVQYLSIVTVPVVWLAFALQYSGREKWLTRRKLSLLAIVPLVTLLLVWTNDVHRLIWSEIGLDPNGPFSVLDLTYGAWFWIHSAYSYLLLVLGTLLLLQALLRSPYLYRGQARVLLIGVLAPWLGNVLSLAGLVPFPRLDLTPFAFTLTGLAVTWGLFRFRLLDIVPAARDAVIEGMGDGVIVLDVQNRIVDLNPAAGRIIGRSASEAIGQAAAQVFSGRPDGSTEASTVRASTELSRMSSAEPLAEVSVELLAEVVVERYRDVTEAQAEIVLGEGEAQCTYDLRISPLYDWHDRLTGRLVVLRDITERKRAEEALKGHSERLEEMVEERTKELRDAQEQLIRKEKLSILGQLAGGVGHELRNPLSIIKNSIYYLNMRLADADEKVKKHLRIMEREIANSDKIISDLLGFARGRKPTLREADVNAMVEEALSRSPVPENVTVTTELGEGLPPLMADPDQIEQVFINIILNAVQAMPDGGRLEIATKAEDGFIVTEFKDTGCGIPEENMKRLFEPLFTTNAKGIGLGLAVSKKIMEAHEGSIEVESEKGKGTTFTVKLPASANRA